MIKVTLGNRKLGSIFAINLPALVTCRADAPCRKLCYAKKGHFLYPNVKNLYEENLNAYVTDPKQAELDIISQLPTEGTCRWHASGDIINREYLEMMVRIAKVRKNVKFMCFTKKYELINQYIADGNTFPKNLKMLFSGWYGLEMDNPYNFPTAYIELKKEHDDRIKKNAIPCTGKCFQCFKCWNVRKGQQVLFQQH